jgi:Protein of unknown function (DUF3574)
VRLRPAGLAAILTFALAGAEAGLLAGCVQNGSPRQAATAPAVQATLHGDAAHPAQTAGWVDTKLYFGLGPADHPEQGITEARWRDFLDREVTPRFPDGLSVLDVYGQWLSKGQTVPERLHTKMLIIYYPDSAESRSEVDAIRAAWKKMTGDQSVLRVTEPADVSF